MNPVGDIYHFKLLFQLFEEDSIALPAPNMRQNVDLTTCMSERAALSTCLHRCSCMQTVLCNTAAQVLQNKRGVL